VIFNATILSGADYFAELCGITNHINSQSIVITGEGRVDASTLTGKAIMPVIKAAAASHAQLIIIGGVIEAATKAKITQLSPNTLFFNISQYAPNRQYSITHASEILQKNLPREMEQIQ
jgi:glycerate kinase